MARLVQTCATMNSTFASAMLVSLALLASACSGGGTAAESPTENPAATRSEAASQPASAFESAAESPGHGEAAHGEATLANDLEPGDCFNTHGQQVDEVSVVDCEDPHVYEAFHSYDLEGAEDAEFPGDEAVLEDADGECRPAFEEYVGTPYDDSALFITVIRPSEATWGEGDRTVICALNDEDEEEMTGSAEGSER